MNSRICHTCFIDNKIIKWYNFIIKEVYVMKHISAKITACVLSVAMTAGILSACTASSESGAKEMLLTAVDSMAQNTSNTLSVLSDASSDKQNGSKATVTVEPGEYLDDLAGVDIKEIFMSADVKIKGGIFGNDMNISYDGKPIADIGVILDQTGEEGYVKVSQLTDKYIKVPMDDETLGDLFGASDLGLDMDDSSSDTYDNETDDVKSEDIVNALKEFDVKGIVSDFDKIIDEMNKNLPESDNEGERTIKENGVEAVFKTKTMKLSDKDDEKTSNAVKEALKNSENIKACVSKISDYDKFIEDLFETDSDDEDESKDSEKITFYYYGDKLVGFGPDNKNYLLSADTADGYISVIKINEDSDSVNLALTAVPDGEKLDMEFNINADVSDLSGIGTPLNLIDSSSASFKLKIDDYEIVNKDIGSFNAKVEGELPILLSGDEKKTDFKIKAEYKGDDNKQEDNGEITVKIDGKEKSVLKYFGVAEQTDASDIKIPAESECVAADSIDSVITEDVYMDWLSQISDALGEDLISAITEKIGDSFGINDDYDYTDDSPLYDLEMNYGIDYYDYYNDDFTEFDMDKFLSDAKKVYPADKFDDLKEEIEEEYENGLTEYPNIDTLYYEYDIDINDYLDDDYENFDKDKFMSDAKKVYPKGKLDELEEEADEYFESMKEMMSSLLNDTDSSVA